MRKGGLEPPRLAGHKILNLARLPIPPLSQRRWIVHAPQVVFTTCSACHVFGAEDGAAPQVADHLLRARGVARRVRSPDATLPAMGVSAPAGGVSATARRGHRPAVAIVGRPNVGKSTLFNRLVGRRRAIVHDLPGVTRDRIVETALLDDDLAIDLIDTGGLVPEREDPLGLGAQVLLAIDESDVLLLVVDGRTGPVAWRRRGARRAAQPRQADRAGRQQGRRARGSRRSGGVSPTRARAYPGLGRARHRHRAAARARPRSDPRRRAAGERSARSHHRDRGPPQRRQVVAAQPHRRRRARAGVGAAGDDARPDRHRGRVGRQAVRAGRHRRDPAPQQGVRSARGPRGDDGAASDRAGASGSASGRRRAGRHLGRPRHRRRDPGKRARVRRRLQQVGSPRRRRGSAQAAGGGAGSASTSCSPDHRASTCRRRPGAASTGSSRSSSAPSRTTIARSRPVD